MTLWPLFLPDYVQGDHFRLFELNDVLTLPAELVEAAAATGWPDDVGVQTTVTIDSDERQLRWAHTADGAFRTRLAAPSGGQLDLRAALVSDIATSELQSSVTGTVRRIELASVPSPEVIDPVGVNVPSGSWRLSPTPVGPVRFRNPFGTRGSKVWDLGILIHLDVFVPRCRCAEVSQLQGDTAKNYAQRHLRAIDVDYDADITRYVCPKTGTRWVTRHQPPLINPHQNNRVYPRPVLLEQERDS